MNFEGFPKMSGSMAFTVADGSTKIVWRSSGTSGGGVFIELMMNYMTAFGVMESAMMKEYDAGLKNLKYRAESASGGPVDASAKKK